MSPKIYRYILIVMLLGLAACTSPTTTPFPTEKPAAATPTASPVPVEENFIVFGDISDDPAEVIEGAQPLADYVAAQLKDYGITGGKVRVAESTEEMVKLLQDGEVDLYFDSTYPATLISDASGAQIILRRWRFGVETYNSVIFASKASGITSIEDLNGKMIAMDAPYSTSGFMLPAVYLTENGLTLAGKPSNQFPVGESEVGFAFAYDDENILQWVLSGLTPAGVTDDYNFDTAFPAEATEQLIELARTESTPRQVGVARKDLEPKLLQAITQALITMHENPEGQAALENFQTTRFDEFPEGIDVAIARIREMLDIVKGIPLP